MSILFSFQSRNFMKLNKSKHKLFRMIFVVCFSFFNKQSLEKKFIHKVERLNVKQRRSNELSRSMLFAKVYYYRLWQ